MVRKGSRVQVSVSAPLKTKYNTSMSTSFESIESQQPDPTESIGLRIRVIGGAALMLAGATVAIVAGAIEKNANAFIGGVLTVAAGAHEILHHDESDQ